MLQKLIAKIAEQTGIDEANISAESKFKEDLQIDSLDLFELVMSIEDEFGVEIPSEDLNQLLSVQDVMNYLAAKGVED